MSIRPYSHKGEIECNGHWMGGGRQWWCMPLWMYKQYGTQQPVDVENVIESEHTDMGQVDNHHFNGSFIQLLEKILQLNSKYFKRIPSKEKVRDELINFKNGVAINGSNKGDSYCIADICITKWELYRNNMINCQLKVRY